MQKKRDVQKSLSILLVLKKSPYQIYFLEQKNRMYLRHRAGEEDVERMRQSHAEHLKSIAIVEEAVKETGVPWRAVYRADQFRCLEKEFIITVGGDGTFLEASHRVKDQCILGINSDPERSIGHFCTGNATAFPGLLKSALQGNAKLRSLNRMALELNGRDTGIRVLNEILVAHAIPAAMSRYMLRIGGISEEQRCSGVWISTAAGSTAAIRSAGGKPMKESSRSLQYLPRELFQPPGKKYTHRGGMISEGKELEIVSLMREGRYYVDGSHLRVNFTYGDKLRIRNSPYPLRVVTA